MIVFNRLTKDDFGSIASIMLSDLRGVLADRGIDLKCTGEAAAYVAEKSYSEKYGARNMRRFIQREIEDRIAEELIADYNRLVTGVTVGVADGELTFTYDRKKTDAK